MKKKSRSKKKQNERIFRVNGWQKNILSIIIKVSQPETNIITYEKYLTQR